MDKYPISIGDDSVPVSFSFIDEGIVTGSRFQSYLNQYGRLFTHLNQFDLVYVAASEAPFRSAEKTFQIFLGSGNPGLSVNNGGVDITRLLTHFEDRKEYDTGEVRTFDRTRLIRLRDDRQVFSGRTFDTLYESWQKSGARALREALAARKSFSKPARARFRTHLLRHNYDVFGTVSKPNGTD